ncbi:NAD(P)H-binding protein [Psychrosphaera aquimarina]|uniref:NAD(P)H-binding protein n=1 Tax=Psychrosphaera aquimarina TaxID=2044854 RepID=A0ABU3R573_9GAMM|nr:NAD(P)H-binding protein [Psychrosphaera aquimarina]MDU0114627.1 NAD(P)H-binding protein [Psychrosphaera aquimarina]
MENKTALIIGATGLVGKQLTRQLLLDDNYQVVHIFVRRLMSLPIDADPNNKLIQHVVNFNNVVNWHEKLAGDELFCCIGTTLKQAGSKLNQIKVDLDLPSEIATYALNNGVNKVILVSSTGAKQDSPSFYLQLKGQLEQNLISMNWHKVIIVRPSFLAGKRDQLRVGEKIAIWLFIGLKYLPFIRRYRPITGKKLAKKMRFLANSDLPDKVTIKELEQLF